MKNFKKSISVFILLSFISNQVFAQITYKLSVGPPNQQRLPGPLFPVPISPPLSRPQLAPPPALPPPASVYSPPPPVRKYTAPPLPPSPDPIVDYQTPKSHTVTLKDGHTYEATLVAVLDGGSNHLECCSGSDGDKTKKKSIYNTHSKNGRGSDSKFYLFNNLSFSSFPFIYAPYSFRSAPRNPLPKYIVPKIEDYRPVTAFDPSRVNWVDFKSTLSLEVVKLSRLKSDLVQVNPTNSQQAYGKVIGLSAVDHADSALAAGNKVAYEAYFKVGLVGLDIAMGLIPGIGLAKNLYEGISGRKLLTGRIMSKGERALCFAAAATLGFGNSLTGFKAIEDVVVSSFPAEVKVAEEIFTTAGQFIDEIEIEYAQEGNVLNGALPTSREPSYVDDGYVISGKTKPNFPTAYRAHRVGEPIGGWYAKDNPLEMGLHQYADKYAMDPKQIQEVSEVRLPPGTNVEISIAGPNKLGSGGGVQIKSLDDVRPHWFKPIGKF